MNTIQLCYRGVEYDYQPIYFKPISEKAADRPRFGQYRGAIWKLPNFKLLLPPQFPLILKYRGAFYVSQSFC
ncbi:DUF4278 domain-containing protein [Egbenema bharatensis]|uniref:DUF4278 domain-containing protein n=1 Tax=Egbenema bharatensis TaxID=3463334 RepID=UPI003A83B5B5